jgi:hypothetical protein
MNYCLGVKLFAAVAAFLISLSSFLFPLSSLRALDDFMKLNYSVGGR